MAQQTIFDKIREWIGGIAWDIFLWSARMTEDEYFDALNRDAELLRAPVQSDAKEACPSYTHIYLTYWHGNFKFCPFCGRLLSQPSDGG
jgi:hypothetical protein